MTARDEAAFRYLAGDNLTNADMIECLRRGIAETMSAEENWALLRTKDDVWLMAADSEEDARRLVSALPSGTDFAAVSHGEAAEKALRERGGFSEIRPCRQAVWTSGARPEPAGETEIRPLGPEYLKTAAEHYSLGLGEEHVAGVIARGELFGAFADGVLAGFIGLHPDGSIGLLEVFPGFRRRGLGTELERFMIRRELDAGHLPYGQILVGNAPSISLAEKAGWTIAPGTVTWFEDR